MKADNWIDALNAAVETYRFRPQEWGVWDCCQFAAECVLRTTGVDHRAAFPAYSSEEEARAIIAGFGGMPALLSSVLGAPIPVAWVKRGGILALPDDICAVCLGVMCATTGAEGLVFAPSATAVAGWSAD